MPSQSHHPEGIFTHVITDLHPAIAAPFVQCIVSASHCRVESRTDVAPETPAVSTDKRLA